MAKERKLRRIVEEKPTGESLLSVDVIICVVFEGRTKTEPFLFVLETRLAYNTMQWECAGAVCICKGGEVCGKEEPGDVRPCLQRKMNLE